MTLATEENRTAHLFERIEQMEELASAPNLDQDQRAKLRNIVQRTLAESDPVRVSVAAKLLGLSERSVRSWTKEGVLKQAATDSPRVLLDPERLHEVVTLLRDLRRRGRDRNLMEHVWYRLSDQALLERADLQESLEQMRRGEGHVVRSSTDPEARKRRP